MKRTVRTVATAAVLSAMIAIAEIPIAALAQEGNDTTEAVGEADGINEAEALEEPKETEEPGEVGAPEKSEGTGDMSSMNGEPDIISSQNAAENDNEGEAQPAAESHTETSPVTVAVPIYNYDIVNVVVPTSYTVALNPYELAIGMGDGTISTAQVVSRNYGVVNKSSRDKIVTVRLNIEDLNGGKITFVDSAEEAMNADADIYAVYLAAVPADASGVRLGDAAVDKNTQAETLANVNMNKAENGAIPLKAGENSFAFKLSQAVYGFADGRSITLGDAANQDMMSQIELTDLAADGKGATAFTFDGAMNPKADWSLLTGGLKISVVYTYENAMGDEMIVEGTGAMVAP